MSSGSLVCKNPPDRLPGGDAGSEELFRPFEQRGADRTGLGIGLAFSRWGVEAHNGRLYARNVEKGCVFTIDLPRSGPSTVLDGTASIGATRHTSS